MREPLDLTRELQAVLHHEIPLSQQIGLTVGEYDGACLSLRAPLAPNVNHKATAFAGSLTAVATLAGWGVVWLILRERDLRGVIVIQESATEYHLPVGHDFVATCRIPSERVIEHFLSALRRRGKARLPLTVDIRADAGQVAVAFTGSYVALSDQAQSESDAEGT
jgi:thioesterase domain-containing protein